MRILIIGLDCATPELLLDGTLPTFRRLMSQGCYGRLRSVDPPITVPAWMCLSTSQDPGSLGVYGFRNRRDWSYNALAIADARAFPSVTLWDEMARHGKRIITVGVPPSYPPRRVNGLSVGCFLTPDTSRPYTYPASLSAELNALVDSYPVDVQGFRTSDKSWLRDEIFAMSRKHFRAIRHLLTTHPWDFFQFVEIGLDRVQHGFWQYHDPEHIHYEGPASEHATVVTDYYRYLDEEVATILELVPDDAIVLVVSDHGAQRLDGGFCVNEWLQQEGLLVLRSQPDRPTPFANLDVDWDQTAAWSEGGYYARVFLNVHGREPRGRIAAGDYERVREDVRARLAATEDANGRALGTLVFYPEEIYRHVRNIAPDLIAYFGGLSWRSVGGVGYQTLHVQENDTGPDACNHAQYGAFILSASGLALRGRMEQIDILDIAPTLLALSGYEPTAEMQGRVLLNVAVEPAPTGA